MLSGKNKLIKSITHNTLLLQDFNKDYNNICIVHQNSEYFLFTN